MFGIPGSPDAPNLNCSDNVPALGTWETAAPAEIAMIDAAGTSLPADPTCALNGVSCIDQQLDCGGAVGTLRVTYAKSDNASGQAPYIKFTYTGPNAKNISMQQYAWRELFEKSDPSGIWKAVERDEPFHPAEESPYCLTSNHNHKRFHYDVRRANDRSFAPAAYTNCRLDSAESKTCYDSPSSGFDDSEMLRNSAYVDSIAHFETFFEVNGKVCARVSWIRTNHWVNPKLAQELAFQLAIKRADRGGYIAVVGPKKIDVDPKVQDDFLRLDAIAENPSGGWKGREIRATSGANQEVPSPMVKRQDLKCRD